MNKIRSLRISKNMSQSDLGAILNCAAITISRYETGQRDIDSATICRLCEIFGCTADYLLGRSDRPDPELTPEEEQLLAAWAAAPSEIRTIVATALGPYKKDASVSAPTA